MSLELCARRACIGVSDIVVPCAVVGGRTERGDSGRADKREQGEVGSEVRVSGKDRVATPLAAGVLERALGEVHNEASLPLFILAFSWREKFLIRCEACEDHFSCVGPVGG